MKRNVYGDRLGLLAQLEVTYADGTTGRVTTDDRWRTAPGPWLSSDLYDGETYDARRELDGWATAGFDDADWAARSASRPAVGELVAPTAPPVRRVEELPVVEVITTPSGRTILDFGQNLVGWIRSTVDGTAGTDDHPAPRRGARGRRARHPPAPQRRGHRPLHAAGRRTRRPGSRASRSTGSATPRSTAGRARSTPPTFVAVVVHTDFERTGWFDCSDRAR